MIGGTTLHAVPGGMPKALHVVPARGSALRRCVSTFPGAAGPRA